MNERIRKLRQLSLDAVPSLSLERAKLLTEFYQSKAAEGNSVPVTRALAFKYLLEKKSIYIEPGELIVGERGPAPKATPTYPEICTHSSADFEILNSREKISFVSGPEERKLQENVISPFWKSNSMRERIINSMDQDWLDSYQAGVFTEFMEQRAPGHTVADEKIFTRGMNDFRREIAASLEKLEASGDQKIPAKKNQLEAMDTAASALISLANRFADKAESMAREISDGPAKSELREIVRICRKVPAQAPATFHEALQYYWFVHLGVITELNTWDSFNPGRLDQHLYPFYKSGLEKGDLSVERARELLQAFWIKFNNQPAPPKVGVTAKESNTYTDFCLINVGGLDEAGHDATNELSYLILDVIKEMRLLQPSSMVQVSEKSPDRLLNKALKIIKTGYGQPDA